MWGDWRVWKGHKRAQKINPAGKVRAAQQKRDRIERWLENGLQEAKNLSLSKQHCSLCPLIYTIMSLNGKERHAGQKWGEYLMLKKMLLTGVEISSLKVNESRCRNQERMGSVLGQRKRQKKIWIFLVIFRLLLAHNLHQVTWASRSAWGSHQWTSRKISGDTTQSKSPKGWDHWTDGALKSK